MKALAALLGVDPGVDNYMALRRKRGFFKQKTADFTSKCHALSFHININTLNRNRTLLDPLGIGASAKETHGNTQGGKFVILLARDRNKIRKPQPPRRAM